MKTFVIFLPIILLCTSKVIADGKRYTYSYDRYGRLECTMHSKNERGSHGNLFWDLRQKLEIFRWPLSLITSLD